MSTSELYKVLEMLGETEHKKFKWFLKNPAELDGFSAIPKSELEKAVERFETVELMVQNYGLSGALKVTAELLKKIPRLDLVELLPNNLSEQRAINLDVTRYQSTLQTNLEDRFGYTPEGWEAQAKNKRVKDIYSNLDIMDGKDIVYEVRKKQQKAKKGVTERSIQYNYIFKHPSEPKMRVRTVLTYGIAGIGKTFLVRKFILDWVEKQANQDVHLLFPINCRQLNSLSQRKCSLVELVHICVRESVDIKEEDLNSIFTTIQGSGNTNYDKSTFKLLFVLDGLDESFLPLDFSEKMERCSVSEKMSVNDLVANLIKGNLLPAARLWITTRPAVANQIPEDSVDIMTVVKGFTDEAKEEYFRKRFSVEQAERILSHIKTSPSLHIMCHIPTFCWITAEVFKKMFEKDESEQIPQTLTEMYLSFLWFQIKMAVQKTKDKEKGSNKEKPTKVIHLLAELASLELQRERFDFNETDLSDRGICSEEASRYSGMFTQIFEDDDWGNEDHTFCFVHPSIQEFLAAVFEVRSVINEKKDADPPLQRSTITEVCMKAVDKALQSPNGHLDLFLCFLLGLSLPSNQDFLRRIGLLERTESSEKTQEELVKYVKKKIGENSSPERCSNLEYCRRELKDSSLKESSLVEAFQHNQITVFKPASLPDSGATERKVRRTTERAGEQGTDRAGDGSEDGSACSLSSGVSTHGHPQEDSGSPPRPDSPVKGSVDPGEVLKDDACGRSDTSTVTVRRKDALQSDEDRRLTKSPQHT